jgi:hypothetical protein
VADGRQFALQIRIGAFILAGLLVFVAIIYLLGARWAGSWKAPRCAWPACRSGG